MSIYSPLKVFHHRDRIERLRQGGYPPPVHLHFVPTNRCNQNCRFCAYRTDGYTSSEQFHQVDEMPTQRMLDLLTEAKECGVKAVEFTGGGEPSVHPHFAAACGVAANHGLDFSVVTNGANLTDDQLAMMRLAKWVRFSIDAGCAETYSRLRRVKPEYYDRARDNLRKLAASRGGKSEPVIGVGFVVTEDNWEEILQAARNAEEDGADNLRISAVFQSEGIDYFSSFYSGARNLCHRAKRLDNHRFKVFDLFGDRLDDLTQQAPDYAHCGVQRFVAYIGADLNVYRCCVLAYNRQGLLGSVENQTFSEFWNDPETRRKLDIFDARKCTHCMFNNKNRTINYALNPNPGHVNFL